MTLHLALGTGSLAITLALAFTPKGRSFVGSIWDWFKGLVFKKVPSPGWRFRLVFRKRSRRGDQVEFGTSFEHEATSPIQNVVPQSKELLSDLQPALGCERPPIPTFPVIPDTVPLLLPPLALTPINNPSVAFQHPLPSIRRSKKPRPNGRLARGNRGPKCGRRRTRGAVAKLRPSPKRVTRRRVSSTVVWRSSARSAGSPHSASKD
jgi:hypothetical protein